MSGGSRALALVAVCLTLSAAARSGDLAAGGGKQAGQAMAAISDGAERTRAPSAEPPERPMREPPPEDISNPTPPPLSKADPDADLLLSMLRQRQVELDQRERHVLNRERELEVVAEKLRAELELLREAESRLSATLARADEAAEQDVAHLVSVYQAMKPKAAAEIFDAMEVGFAAGFLSRMQSEPAAQILAAMDAGAAYAVSVVMAGRNARAPTE